MCSYEFLLMGSQQFSNMRVQLLQQVGYFSPSITAAVLRCISATTVKCFSTTYPRQEKKSYKLVVIGGGAGGCSIAAKFSPKLGKKNVAIIEPSDVHYYQPLWTLVGGGLKTVDQSGKSMEVVLPKNAEWIKDKVVKFEPDSSKVYTSQGHEVSYDYMVVALGIQINWNNIKGLPEAFETPGVCSNYSPVYCTKTYQCVQDIKEGNAVFTFPNTPIKCAGAPQKVMYLSEENFQKLGKRDKVNVIYNTSLPVLFGIKKYSDALWKVVNKRNINVNLRQNLIEVKPDTKEAVFQNLDKPEETMTLKYGMLHVGPPCSAPDVLKGCPELTDESGFLAVSQDTLQHDRYKNVFGIGDCINAPTAKTAAAVACQLGILRRNLGRVIAGKTADATYDGYTSCPLVTGKGKCILAEFSYGGQPLETFPINQGKEMWTSYHLKAQLMPFLYWSLMLNGYWEGPKYIRKTLHLGMSK